MVSVTQFDAIIVVSTLGALGQAILTLRYYEPSVDAEPPPTPVVEAVFFLVGFAIFFGVLGMILSAVAGLAPPYTQAGIVLLTPAGLYSAWATHEGRFGSEQDTATRVMGIVTGVVIGLYPLVLVLV